MTENAPLARRATELLADSSRRAAEAPGPVSEDTRARGIAAARAAIAAHGAGKRVRRVRAFTVGLIAAAAVALSVGAGLRTRRAVATTVTAHAVLGEPTLWRLGIAEPLRSDVPLRAGDRLRTLPGTAATLSMSTGSAIALEGGGDLTLVAAETAEVLALSAGAARFQVAKVGAGRRFVVRTDDAEIEVKGTAFRVTVAGDDPRCAVATRTRVEVTEGRVVVRHLGVEVVLDPGGRWPAGCGGPVAAAPAPVPAPAATVPSALAPPQLTSKVALPPNAVGSSLGAATAAGPPKDAPASATDLTQQNDLFTAGLDKKRAGDLAGARAAFDRYLALYPGGALAESATVEKMRLLKGEPARAVAKSYLGRWPKGFARAEAQALLEP